MLDQILEALPTLELSELSDLQTAIHAEITSRSVDYRFEFEATADPRKGYPCLLYTSPSPRDS